MIEQSIEKLSCDVTHSYICRDKYMYNMYIYVYIHNITYNISHILFQDTTVIWKVSCDVTHSCMLHYIYIYIYSSQETPPLGGVSYLAASLTKNPDQEDLPRRICTMCFEGGPSPPVSWLGSLPNRAPPGGRGFLLSINQSHQIWWSDGKVIRRSHKGHCKTIGRGP